MSNSDNGFSINTPNTLNKFNQRAEWAVVFRGHSAFAGAERRVRTALRLRQAIPRRGNHFISKQVIGGWQFSGTFQYEAGSPFGIGGSGSPLATGGNRADVVPGAPIHLNYKNYYKNLPVYNTAAFTDPGQAAVGNAARNQSDLRDPFSSVENIVTLAKKFFFGAGVQAELRMEYFNILNRMTVCGPSDNNAGDGREANGGNYGYVVGPCQAIHHVRARRTSGSASKLRRESQRDGGQMAAVPFLLRKIKSPSAKTGSQKPGSS